MLKKNGNRKEKKKDTVTWKIHLMEHPLCNGATQIRVFVKPVRIK